VDHIGVAGGALLIFFVAVPLLTLWVHAVVDVFRRRDLSAGGVVAWLIALVLLPVVTSVLYLLRRRVEDRPRDMIEHVPSRVAPSSRRGSFWKAPDPRRSSSRRTDRCNRVRRGAEDARCGDSWRRRGLSRAVADD